MVDINWDYIKQLDNSRKANVIELLPVIRRWHYGATMHETQQLWEAVDPKGCFTIGPCKAATVPCGCKKPHKCDWCCGTGWLTKHVKAIKDREK